MQAGSWAEASYMVEAEVWQIPGFKLNSLDASTIVHSQLAAP